MPKPFRFAVDFQVRHPLMHSDEICEALAMNTEVCWNVGDRRVTPKGTELTGTRRETYCSFDIGSGADGRLANFLRDKIESLQSHAAFLRSIRETGGSLLFYVFWYPNGDTGEVFDIDLLAGIAELGIELGINVYDDRRPPAEFPPRPSDHM